MRNLIFQISEAQRSFRNKVFDSVEAQRNCRTAFSYHANAQPIEISRGGVEDTRLEAKAKAKDTKKIRGQSQGQGQPFRGQTLSRPRTGMLEAKAKDQGPRTQSASALQKKKNKRSSQNFFRRSPKKKKKKKVFTKIFQAISTKNRFPKNFSTAPQNFNFPKNSAVLEPRTGQFSRT